ncbi:hypothetical protein PAXINDRAFT_11157 [Paxillus involutus ATCC 200175]|nr:hypothetical protein PAXINDRAFT_11157 [Paxillus involutus ATCC 200175]
MTSSYPRAIAFPPPPPTSNTLSSRERSVLVRTSKKLGRILGDMPRFVDEDPNTVSSSRSSNSSGLPELTRTTTNTTTTASLAHKADAESSWHKRKPTHLPPLLKLSGAVAVDSSSPTLSPASHHATRRGSVLSTAPSIVSNAPSAVSGSSNSDAPSESSQRRTKIERLRRKLGDEVPFDVVFPSPPRSPRSPRTPRTAVPKTPRGRPSTHAHARSRSTHTRPDDARSIAFSISSDEGVQTVTLSTSTHVRSPHPHKSKHTYHTGALPPVPPLPAHMSSSRRAQGDGDDAGLIRPRQKVAAGSKIGGSDFKAARRAKREGRSQTGQADVGELIEMVGFMGGGF